MPSLPAGAKLGRYTIEGSVGEGAFGEVFLAHYDGPGGFRRRVAIKVLSPEAVAAEKGVESFHREGRTAALLSHRNVIQVIDVGRQGPHHFLVMEHVEGIDLARFGERVGREVPGWIRLGIILEVARGLAHAHGLRREECPHGVVHRDVKPPNILLGVAGDVKLSDFGLAKRCQLGQDQLTAAGMIKGTPGFMSPQALVGEESGAPGDIYALGAVLFWLFAGRVPRLALGKSPFVGLPEGTVPAGLEPIVEVAMHPSVERRPSAEELVGLLGGELARIAPAGAVAGFADELGRWVARARERGPGSAGGREGSRTQTADAPGQAFRPAVQAATPETIPDRPATPSGSATWRWGLLVAGVALLGMVAGFLASGDLTCGSGSVRRPPDLALSQPPEATADLPALDLRGPDLRGPDLRGPDLRGLDLQARDRRGPARRRHRRTSGETSAPAPRGTGLLSVDTDPWSWVYLDGRRLGMTPLWQRVVPAGRHRLELRGDRAAVQRRVRVAPGQHLNLGRILLR